MIVASRNCKRSSRRSANQHSIEFDHSHNENALDLDDPLMLDTREGDLDGGIDIDPHLLINRSDQTSCKPPPREPMTIFIPPNI